MRKIIIITLALIILSCEKEKDQYPIKYQSTCYSNGYVIQNQQDPITLIADFVALQSVSQGNDADYYDLEFYKDKELSTQLIKFSISVKATESRNKKVNQTVYKQFVLGNSVCYYRIIRNSDNAKSETRSINFNWVK